MKLYQMKLLSQQKQDAAEDEPEEEEDKHPKEERKTILQQFADKFKKFLDETE